MDFTFFKLENCLYQPSYVPVFQVCRPEGASSVISKIVLVMLKQQPSLKWIGFVRFKIEKPFLKHLQFFNWNILHMVVEENVFCSVKH